MYNNILTYLCFITICGLLVLDMWLSTNILLQILQVIIFCVHRKKGGKPFYIVLQLLVLPSAIVIPIAVRWKILWRWILLYAVMTVNG
mgnify:CR=1 FL=1